MNCFKKTSTVIILHSTAYYLISYLVILLIFKFVSSLAAGYFDIPTIMLYNRTDFLGKANSWNFDSVKMIFSSGYIAALIFGLICLVIFLKAMTLEGLLKLLFFWGFVHGLNMFVGSIVTGAFIFEGMGYVFDWMYLTETVKLFLLMAGLFVLMGAGILLVKPMLLTANTYFNQASPGLHRSFRSQQFLYPYLIGTVILILLRFPISLYECLLLVTPVFIIIPLYMGFHRNTIFYFDEKERTIRLKAGLLVVAVGLLAFFRLIFGIGIRIG